LGQPPAVIREGQGVRELPATHRYAAAVLAVFNAPEKRAGRFVSLHHAPLRAVSPGLAGWQDRQTLELAELGIFEVRHAPNHARRALDPNYAGEVFDHRRQAWPRDDCGMLSPLGEWLLALSPEVEAKLASMPPAEREDFAAVAAMLAEGFTASGDNDREPNAPAHSRSIDNRLHDMVLAIHRAQRPLTDRELVGEISGSAAVWQRTAADGRRRGLIATATPGTRKGRELTDAGRALAMQLDATDGAAT